VNRELLPIDNGPIRRQAEQELERIRKLVASREGEISAHELYDLPVFRRWISDQCSDLLSEKVFLDERAQFLRGQLAAIHALKQSGIHREGEAYFWFQQIARNEKAVPPRVQRAWDQVTVRRNGANHESAGVNPENEEGAETGRFHQNQADEEFGNDTDPGAEAGEYENTVGDRSDESRRVKSLYRKIVRLLHPDAAGQLSQHELELWYQTQQAYEKKDIFALETILARCDRVGTNYLSISGLRSLIDEANDRLEILRRSIVVFSERPGWGFRELSQNEKRKLLRPVRTELEIELRVLVREVSALERRLERSQRLANSWLGRRQDAPEQNLLLL
jgi:hypothetical protein